MKTVKHIQTVAKIAMRMITNVIIAFSWRWSTWSNWPVGTFCCH